MKMSIDKGTALQMVASLIHRTRRREGSDADEKDEVERVFVVRLFHLCSDQRPGLVMAILRLLDKTILEKENFPISDGILIMEQINSIKGSSI